MRQTAAQSQLAFDALLPDEAACEALLIRTRWPDGFRCPRCGSADATRLATRALWQSRSCRKQTSVRSNTVLHRSSTPLRKWLYAMWCTARFVGISALQLQQDLA